jgi:hypothetical protein
LKGELQTAVMSRVETAGLGKAFDITSETMRFGQQRGEKYAQIYK